MAARQVLVHHLGEVVRRQLDDGQHLRHGQVADGVFGLGVVKRRQLLAHFLGDGQVELGIDEIVGVEVLAGGGPRLDELPGLLSRSVQRTSARN